VDALEWTLSVLAILIKCMSFGFFVGFLLSTSWDWGAELWALAGLMLFAGGLVALYELSILPRESMKPTISPRKASKQ
jgi:hypothetical protein